MELYPSLAVERAMKVQDVIMRAISGKILWMQAAEILGVSPRTMRRVKCRYEQHGYDGLLDRRRRRPSEKRVPLETVRKVVELFQERYFDFNVKHFVEKLHGEHGISLSYTWVKNALQAAGLVVRRRKRGTHRRKRSRRPLRGMLLHIDGSRHAWLGAGQGQQDLVSVMDDATSEIYYAQLVEEESTATVMAALKEVIEKQGLFCALYSDRGSHFVYTPKAGGPPDRQRLTQIGRALSQLGIELIPANSPQARGRCERSYGTLQGRLPQELRLRGLISYEGANLFLREVFLAEQNRKFTVPSSEKGTAFVPYRGKELEKILSHHDERIVSNDNVVVVGSLSLQIPPQTFRFSLARCRVLACRLLDSTLKLYYGPHLLGHYSAQGKLLSAPSARRVRRSILNQHEAA